MSEAVCKVWLGNTGVNPGAKFLHSKMLGHRAAHVLQRAQLAPRLFSGIQARASNISAMAEPVKVSANCGQLPVGVSVILGPCCSFAARVRLHARTPAALCNVYTSAPSSMQIFVVYCGA